MRGFGRQCTRPGMQWPREWLERQCVLVWAAALWPVVIREVTVEAANCR
jgi:hypothetical protein